MQVIGNFRKLDQKNRVHIPQDVLRVAKIEDESEVYICALTGENFVRIYSKEKISEEKKDDE